MQRVITFGAKFKLLFKELSLVSFFRGLLLWQHNNSQTSVLAREGEKEKGKHKKPFIVHTLQEQPKRNLCAWSCF